MKLGDARANYYEATSTTSTLVRQLALAAIAVVWLLTGGFDPTSHALRLSVALLLGLAFALLSLICDILQYAWRAVGYAGWARASFDAKSQHGSVSIENEDDLEIGSVPNHIRTGAWIFFWVKMASLLAAYVLVGAAIAHRITVT